MNLVNFLQRIERMGLNVNQELFEAFAFYAAIVVVKMLIMSPLTIRWILSLLTIRFSTHNQVIFPNLFKVQTRHCWLICDC